MNIKFANVPCGENGIGHKKIPPNAKLVFGILHSISQIQGGGWVVITQKRIGQLLGIKERQVGNVIKVLVDKGFINKKNSNKGAEYFINSLENQDNLDTQDIAGLNSLDTQDIAGWTSNILPVEWQDIAGWTSNIMPVPPYILESLNKERNKEGKFSIVSNYYKILFSNFRHHFTLRFEETDLLENLDKIEGINSLVEIERIGNALKLLPFCAFIIKQNWFNVSWFLQKENMEKILNLAYIGDNDLVEVDKILKYRGYFERTDKIKERLEELWSRK